MAQRLKDAQEEQKRDKERGQMNGWKVQKSLWPFLDKLEDLGIFGSTRDEVVNTLLCMEVVYLIREGVIDGKVKKPRTWFPFFKR